jgi:ribosomal subunit interface protein
MDVLLKGRGHRITEHEREAAGKKLAHLAHQEPRAVRVEVEIIDQNPRLGGAKRVEASLDIPRKTFRAHADGPDVDTALDEVVGRLRRQVRDHADRRRSRTARAGNRLDSAGAAAPEEPVE